MRKFLAVAILALFGATASAQGLRGQVRQDAFEVERQRRELAESKNQAAQTRQQLDLARATGNHGAAFQLEQKLRKDMREVRQDQKDIKNAHFNLAQSKDALQDKRDALRDPLRRF